MPISTQAEKLQQTADELGQEPDLASIPFIYTEGMKLKLRQILVTQNLLSGSNSFILGHPVNGVLGVATGLGGGQIVLGQSGANVITELVRRSYDWRTADDFDRGTKSENVDTSQGFIQMGNVTIRNILLEHKTK